MANKIASHEATYDPTCPFCEKKIHEVHWRMMDAADAEYMFIGPSRRNVMGIGARNAAWIN